MKISRTIKALSWGEKMPFLRGIQTQQGQNSIKLSIDSEKLKPTTSPVNLKASNHFRYNIATTNPRERLINFWRVWQQNASNRGLLYERFIGYHYEKAGFNVLYNGILYGSNDMGRDLICSSSNIELIIQCKCLRSGSVYPKDIHQLFGTSIQYGLEHPNKVIRGILFTTTGFTHEAVVAAGKLGIYIKDKQQLPSEFPIIRCISQLRQYYLPDDWDYFFSDFDIRKGDIYYQTVNEAEQHGFTWAHKT